MNTDASTVRSRLNAEQIAEYQREGFLVLREPVFSEARFAALKAHFERMLAELPPAVRPEGMIGPHYVNTDLFEYLFDDAVLDLVEPLLGPDIALLGSHFICKSGGDGKRVPWHEDSAYWKDMMSPMEEVTVWLAIDPSDTENGCMRVIPRTHHNGFSGYEAVDPALNVFNSEIRKQERDESRAVDIILAPNQCSLHDARLMHSSNRNTSARRRCGYTMRYVSARTRLNPSYESSLHFYMARGRDLAGNNYGDPTRTYPEKVLARDKNLKYVQRSH